MPHTHAIALAAVPMANHEFTIEFTSTLSRYFDHCIEGRLKSHPHLTLIARTNSGIEKIWRESMMRMQSKYPERIVVTTTPCPTEEIGRNRLIELCDQLILITNHTTHGDVGLCRLIADEQGKFITEVSISDIIKEYS